MATKCPECGEVYSGLANHWNASKDCDYPSISDKQFEITEGLIMGDANLDKEQNRNARLKINLTKKEFLEFLDKEIFKVLGTGVNQSNSKHNSNFESATDFSDIYRWQTVCHPQFSELKERWYTKTGKEFPESLKLTPRRLKYWYISDGSIYTGNKSPYITISACNEYENKEKIQNYFEEQGLEKPNWAESKRIDGSTSSYIYFTKNGSKQLWEYMGSPPPGFGYKWPEEFK